MSSKQSLNSFGPLFKELREKSGLSLDKLSELSKISKNHLTHLEQEEFEKLPPAVYARGFIAKCCKIFECDTDSLLRLYGRQSNLPLLNKERGRGEVVSRLYITPKHLRFAGVSLFLLAIAIYLFIKFIPFLFSPEIHLEKPATESIVVNFSQIEVAGYASNTSSLTLNSEELYIEKNGKFNKTFDLAEGINRLVFTAHSIFGRKSEVVRKVVYIKN